jgi:hypothetical protein
MQQHRFLEQIAAREVVEVPAASAFVVFPLALAGGAPAPWQQIYQVAYERAQAVVRPSRLERLQAAWLN